VRLIDPGATPSRDSGHSRRLKGVVRDALALPHDAVVLVSELRCGESDCAPLETVIAVPADHRTWSLPYPTAEVSPYALRVHLLDHPEGERGDHPDR
jgi:hypothetical protein